jgi:hypothetical protein
MGQSSGVGFRPYWPALILSAVPAACLVWGIVTGNMPQRYGTFNRRSNAAGFWIMAIVWSGLLGISLWVALRL